MSVQLRRFFFVLVGLTLAGGVALELIDASNAPHFPEGEGFAIWPIDTPAEADAECAPHDRFTWRGSPEGTARRFVREMLRTTDADLRTDVQDEGTRVVVNGGGLSYEHHVRLIRLERCWYVTSVGEVEAEGFASLGYAGEGAERRLFLHVPSDAKRPRPYGGSLGSGDSERRFDRLEPVPNGGGLLVTVPAPRDEPGHYLLGPLDEAAPTLSPADGATLPPPFDPGALPVAPPAEYTRRVLSELAGDAGPCERWYWADYSRKHAVKQAMTSVNHYAAPSPPFEWRRVDRDHYVVTINGVEIEFEFWTFTKKCRVLGRISTADKPYRIAELRARPGACAFSLAWDRADEAKLSCGFGEVSSNRTTARLPNPIHFGVSAGNSGIPFEDVMNAPGHFFVSFYDDDELIGIEGGVLPPPNDIP